MRPHCTWTALGLSALLLAGRASAMPKAFSAEESAWIRAHVGMYIWPALDFPGYDYSVGENADTARALGTRIVRVIFEPRFFRQPDLVALAEVPDYRGLFRRFDVVALTMPRWDPNEPEGFPDTERAYHDFTRYLLDRYAEDEKTFILGFWEGDNAGLTGPRGVDWCQARHRGIEAGCREAPASRSRVLEMIEFNFDGISPMPPQKTFSQESCMVRTVVPHTAADLYSFSMWMDLRPTPFRRLPSALDYLAGVAPDGETFGERNVMLGETGIWTQVYEPEGEFEAARQTLAEAREWGVPYVIWWWLAGRQLGLIDAPIHGGRKSPMWHPFWAAYHGADDPFVIDDFDEADFAQDGALRNHLGGAHSVWSSCGAERVGLAAETWDGGGALRVQPFASLSPEERAEWRTETGCLDARPFDTLQVALAPPAEAEVGLCDTDGRWAWVAWKPAVPLKAFRSREVDLARVTSIGLRLPPDTRRDGLLIDSVAFAREVAPQPPAAEMPAQRTVHVPVDGLAVPEIPVPRPASAVERFELQVAEQAEAVINPRLSLAGRDLFAVERVPPGGRVYVQPGGTGALEFTVPFRQQAQGDFARCGLVPHGLRWEPEYHVFMATVPREPAWFEMTVNSHHPITGGQFMLEGKRTGSARWGVTAFQGDRGYEAESVATFQWVERELFRLPADWPPYSWIRLRLWLAIDRDDPGWEWDGSLTLLQVHLDLDTSQAPEMKPSPDEPLIYIDREGQASRRLVSVTFRP